jgi:hypothetical protein
METRTEPQTNEMSLSRRTAKKSSSATSTPACKISRRLSGWVIGNYDSDKVAAPAVRIECVADGRFSCFQLQSFTRSNHLRICLLRASSCLWRMSSAQNRGGAYIASANRNASRGASAARLRHRLPQTRRCSVSLFGLSISEKPPFLPPGSHHC